MLPVILQVVSFLQVRKEKTVFPYLNLCKLSGPLKGKIKIPLHK